MIQSKACSSAKRGGQLRNDSYHKKMVAEIRVPRMADKPDNHLESWRAV
jgi:hypothetical protein